MEEVRNTDALHPACILLVPTYTYTYIQQGTSFGGADLYCTGEWGACETEEVEGKVEGDRRGSELGAM